MKIKKSVWIAVAMLTFSSAAYAQSYYDDDIYFDSSKSSAEKKKVEQKNQQKAKPTGNTIVRGNDGNTYIVTSDGYAYPTAPVAFEGADAYVVNSGSTRDVDEYNRRYSVVDSIPVDSLSRDGFANTRMIERFSNPDIVLGSGDEELIQYYVASQPSEVNIYLNPSPVYYSSSLYPYYWNRWAWGWDPWYTAGWYTPGWYSPYWSWSWGWDPWYGPGWGPAWYPGPGWGHGPGWAHVWNPRPPVSPGATRPHRPGEGYASGATGGYRGNYGSHARPSSSGGYRGNAAGARPAAGNYSPSRPSAGNAGGGVRPSSGNYGGGRSYRPNASSVVSGAGTRPSGSNYGGGRSSSRTENNYSTPSNRNNSSSYSSPSRSSSSSGGFRSGGHSGGRSGGGHSGGGGRGGRR